MTGLEPFQRAEALVRSALSASTRRALRLLDADPLLSRHDMACACVSGDAGEVSRRLREDPSVAGAPTGPLGHPPIIYTTFTRLLRDRERAPGIREATRLLLEAGADPNASFMHGDWLQVPLYGAAGIAWDAELTAMLLAAGADPNDAGEHHRVGEALYHACESPDPACAQLLIEAGTERDVVVHCLGRALNFDHPEMVEMFCRSGITPLAQHLHQALWRRRPLRTVAALLDAGAPLDEPDEHGLTPLAIARRWDDGATEALLLERGADPGPLASQEDPSAADLDEMVILAVQGGRLETVRTLLEGGARVDGNPESEDTPLGQACWRRRVEVVRELLARGAATEFRDGGSAIGAALHGSRHCNDPEGGPTMAPRNEIPTAPYAEIVRMLLSAGARVPERIGERGRPVAKLLADLGVDSPPRVLPASESEPVEPGNA